MIIITPNPNPNSTHTKCTNTICSAKTGSRGLICLCRIFNNSLLCLFAAFNDSANEYYYWSRTAPLPSPPTSQPLSYLHLCLTSSFDGICILQYGESPLWIASINGQLDIVKTLIEAGADVNQTNKVCSLWHCTYQCHVAAWCWGLHFNF